MRNWNELSMAEKADVMKLAVEGGVYDLDAIRSGYNKYAKGGKIHIDPSKKGTFTAAASRHGMGVQQFASKVLAHPENYSPAMRKKANFARNAAKWRHEDGGNLYPVGGFIGGFPAAPGIAIINGLRKAKGKIRQRLYDNVIPYGYNNPAERAASAIVLNKPSSKQEMPDAGNYAALDELWATYLNIPQSKRHYDPTLKVSKYKPTKSKDNNTTYYSIPFGDEEKQEILDIAYADDLRPLYYRASTGMSPELGEYTIDKGRDSKGDYVSYYDKWDLNPFRGITNIGNSITDFLGLDNIGDISAGIGKPVEVYDRIYLDDYYEIPHKDKGGHYLPEVTIKGEKKDSGYKIWNK